MRRRTRGLVAVATTVGLLQIVLISEAAAPLGEYTPVATGGETPGFDADVQPRRLALGPDGLLWFTDSDGVNRINADGTVTRFDAEPTFGDSPSLFNIVTGPDGNLWFTKFSSPGQIGRITPTGTMTAMTSFTDSNVHDIIVGPDGNLWYTRPFVAGAGGVVGKITTAGVTTEYPTDIDAQPRELAVGPDGLIWYSDDGDDVAPNSGGVFKVTTDGVTTPVAEAGVTPGFPADVLPYDIAVGPDGNFWFAASTATGGAAVRVTLAGVVTTFTDPDMAFLRDIVVACGSLFASQSAESDDFESAVWRITTDGTLTQLSDGLPPTAVPDGILLGSDDDVKIADAGEPPSIQSLGAGCSAPAPAPPAPTPVDVAPDFTG